MKSCVCPDPQCMHFGNVPSASPGVDKAQRAPTPGLPCLPPSPAKPGLHSQFPSSELWVAVVSGRCPERSESPCPRTITGGGDGGGGQVGRLETSSAEWGEMEAMLPIIPFHDILTEVWGLQYTHCHPRGALGNGCSGTLGVYLLPCRRCPSGSVAG